MTKDEIIKLAREAGIDKWWNSGSELRETFDAHLEAFARACYEAGRTAERNECAKVCEERSAYYDSGDDDRPDSRRAIAAKACAAAIRARGKP